MGVRLHDSARRVADERDPQSVLLALVEAGWPETSLRVQVARDRIPVIVAEISRAPRVLVEVPISDGGANRAAALGYSSESAFALSWKPDAVRLLVPSRWRQVPGDTVLAGAASDEPAAVAGLLRLVAPEVVASRQVLLPETRRVSAHDSLPHLLGQVLAEVRATVAQADAWQGRPNQDLLLLRLFHQLLFMRFSEDRGDLRLPRVEEAATSDSAAMLAELLNDYRGRFDSELFEAEAFAIDDLGWDQTKKLLRALVEPWKDLRLDFRVSRHDLAGRLYESYLGSRPSVETDPNALFATARAVDVRKKSSSFFTPSHLARRLVDSTLGSWLLQHEPQAPSEVRVLDPACGSGVFLVAAYEILDRYFAQLYGRELTLTERQAIVTQSLFGADRDPAALLLTRVHLLEQADLGREGFPLPRLEENLFEGDSLLAPPVVTHVPADSVPWAEILRRNGMFDVVVTNPPFGAPKTLAETYGPTHASRLRQLYPLTRNWGTDQASRFIELALSLISSRGRAGFVVPESLTKGKSGGATRAYLADWGIESLLDCADLRLFGSADAYVDLLLLAPGASTRVAKMRASEYDSEASLDPTLSQRLQEGGWEMRRRLTPDEMARSVSWSAFALRWEYELAGHLTRETVPLRQLGSITQGTQTGDDARFVLPASRVRVDDAIRSSDRVRVDGISVPRSAVGRWTPGSTLKPFDISDSGRIVFLPKADPQDAGVIRLTAKLGGRAKHPQPGDVALLTRPKILLRTGFSEPAAVADLDGDRVPNKGLGGAIAFAFELPPPEGEAQRLLALEALLNSSLYQWLIYGLAAAKAKGYRQLAVEHAERLPVPMLSPAEHLQLATAGAAVRAAMTSGAPEPDVTMSYWESREAVDELVAEIVGMSAELREILDAEAPSRL